MEIGATEKLRMERAHVHAWPALQSETVDGWLWRLSGGGSRRANSVSTVAFTGKDVEAAIAEMERRYRARATAPLFQTVDVSLPADLPQRLRAAGYTDLESTITMFKRIEPRPEVADMEVRDAAWPEWLAAYLQEITEDRRAINTRILSAIPSPRAFFAYLLDGQVVATALCAVSFGCAVIECVTTCSGFRRRGYAQAVLTALEGWAAGQDADLIGLQVVATNAPAVTLYERLGFVAGATNRFWQRA